MTSANLSRPGTVLLSGIVGSHAYGLNHPGSDVDRLGVFAAPTIEFHGLHLPILKAATVVRHEPDVVFHEAGKFCALALKGNPTVMEALWLPEWETQTLLGARLVMLRERFLAAPHVRSAYLGYATSQFRRLENEGQFPNVPRSRIAKHARHLRRLLVQGVELWRTGKLVLQVDEPASFFTFGEQVADDPEVARAAITAAETIFDNTATVLPNKPDEAAVEEWLRAVRHEYYPHDHHNVMERKR